MSSDPDATRTRRLLVTGGSGFIGTNVVEGFLRDEFAVLNIDIAAPRDSSQAPYWQQLDIMNRGGTGAGVHLVPPRPGHSPGGQGRPRRA